MNRIFGIALIAVVATTGLTACMGDDDGGSAAERRRSAALVNTTTAHALGELTIAGLTATGQAIEVESFSWGLTNPGGVAPQFEGFNFTKLLDEASPQLYRGAAQGTTYASAVLKLNRVAEDRVDNYAAYELTGVQITSVQQASPTDRIPTESVSLKFAGLKETFTVFNAAGVKGATSSYLHQLKS